MNRIIVWWLKHSLVIMAVTCGLYGLGQTGCVFEAGRFPFKILLMLLVIEATPLGAMAGWLVVKTVHFFSFLLHKFSRSHRGET